MEEACGVVDVKRVASVADRGIVKLRAQMRDREFRGCGRGVVVLH